MRATSCSFARTLNWQRLHEKIEQHRIGTADKSGDGRQLASRCQRVRAAGPSEATGATRPGRIPTGRQTLIGGQFSIPLKPGPRETFN